MLKLVRDMKPFDTASVVEAGKVYQTRGKAEDDANASAIEDHLADLRAQRLAIVDKVMAEYKARMPDRFEAAAAPAPAAPAAPVSPEAKAKDDLMAGLSDLANLLGKNAKLNMVPEVEQKLLPVLTRIFDAAFRLGHIKFKAAAKYVLEQIRAALGKDIADQITIDHLQGAYITMAGSHRSEGAESTATVAQVADKAAIEAYVEPTPEKADTAPKEPENVQRRNPDLERDSADPAPGVGSMGPVDGAGRLIADGGPGQAGQGSGVVGGLTPGDTRVSNGGAVAPRERGDLPLYPTEGEPLPSELAPGIDDAERGDLFGEPGVRIDQGGPDPTGQSARPVAQADKRHQQAAAAAVKIIPGDAANIAESLPFLNAGQQSDVGFAERRFGLDNGYGVLFTNGTGTGKTYTGLGIARRFERQGKGNILIAAPTQKVMEDWINSGKNLGLSINALESTSDNGGKGIVITTYANLGANDTLGRRDWDLVITDEAHYLMQEKDGNPTGFLHNLRAISMHPRGRYRLAEMRYHKEFAAFQTAMEAMDQAQKAKRSGAVMDALKASLNTARKAWTDAQDKTKALVESRQGAARTRVVFLSATPFAYEKNVDYAEGYLFSYEAENTSGGYNSGSPFDRFMMQHFGYTMRTGKLNQPGPEVDSGMMQRQFNTWLKREKVLSGRMLDVKPDYDRKFVLVESAIGRRIDEALDWLRAEGVEDRAESAGRYELHKIIGSQFDYLQRRFLLEAIKAQDVIPVIKAHQAMGRKVVVFHDYKKGGGFHPFKIQIPKGLEVGYSGGPNGRGGTVKIEPIYEDFKRVFKDLISHPFEQMDSPIEALGRAFPNAQFFNGDVPIAKRKEAVARFQADGSPYNLIVVQSAAGKEGISLHDTTGQHQRVLINLGLPTQPTTAIQQEGRIYRTGQMTDALMRYLNTGTSWERQAFANTIARRASTAENLAQGEGARALLDSFIQSFEESDTYEPGHEGEGKGGKERDKAMQQMLSEFDRAKTYYFSQQKKNSRTKSQEGNDYFATPEPVGLKMVEFLRLRSGEHSLEPSGGHGAIARWLPENTHRRAIEPSRELSTRLALAFDGEIVNDRFENHNVVNKYDGIVMNPPFGVGGKTAIEHLAKAWQHLRDGGRIVALLPTGPAADARLEKFLDEGYRKVVDPLYKDERLGTIYRGDTLTFEYGGKSYKKVVRTVHLPEMYGGKPGAVWVDFQDTAFPTINLAVVTAVDPTGKSIVKKAEAPQLVADIRLPTVTFARAGTGVATRIIVLQKGEFDGQTLQRDYTDEEDIKGLFDQIENLDMPDRPVKVEPVAPVPAVTALLSGRDGKLPESKPYPTPGAAPAAGAFTSFDQPHTQKGGTQYMAAFTSRVEREVYDAASALAKKHGGYYSRYQNKATNTKPGFTFKTAAERDAFVAEASAQAQNQVREPEAAYTVDLFGDPFELAAVPNAPRATGNRRPRPAASTGDGQPAGALRDTRPPTGEYYAKTLIVASSQRELGASVIKTADDLAAATRYIYRSAVERFDAIVTDKAGKPLAVVGSFKGAIAETRVYPTTMLAEAVRVPGGANIWFSHNHPSGNPELSQADRMMHRALIDLFRDSGLKPRSIIAVANKRFSGVDENGGDHYASDIPADRGTITVPVLEREIDPNDDPARRDSVSSPSVAILVAKQLYKKNAEPGMMLLDSRNRVVAWVPVSPAMGGALRPSGGLAALYQAVSHANPASVILVHGGEYSATNNGVRVFRNIGAALKAADVQPLDVINATAMNGQESLANVGAMPSFDGPVYSRGDGPLKRSPQLVIAGLDAKTAGKIVDTLTSGWENAPPITVLATPADAPFDAPDDANGALYRGQVYLFASNLRSADDLQFTLFHEALGHTGLRGMLGAGMDAELQRIANLNAGVRKAAATWSERFGSDAIQQRVQGGMSRTDARAVVRLLAIEEALADMAGSGKPITGLQRFMAKVQELLRAIGFERVANWLENATDAEVASLLAKARAWVEGDGHTTTAGELAATFSRQMSDAQARKAYKAIFDKLGQEGLGGLVFNWNESEIDEDGNLKNYAGRDRAQTMAGQGGSYRVSKADFVRWLMSDAPFDAAKIEQDAEWRGQVDAARSAVASPLADIAPANAERIFYTDTLRERALGGLPLFSRLSDQLNGMNKDAGGDLFQGGPELDGGMSFRDRQTSSPAFKRWFGDSKVVDAEGKPLVVYHGTTADIERFNDNESVAGFHFGSASQASMRIAGQTGRNLLPTYLSIQNPRRSKDTGGKWAPKIRAAKAAGHDGIVYLNRYEGIPQVAFQRAVEKIASERGGNPDYVRLDALPDEQFRRYIPEAEDSYIAFEPTQIKSAIGNNGNFDPKNDSIVFNRAQAAQGAATAPAGLRDRARTAIARVDALMEPLGTLPNQKLYLTERYKALGRVARVDEIAGNIGKVFKNATEADRTAAYEYLTTAEASPLTIVGEETRRETIALKRLIGSVGDALVMRGLLSEEAREEYRDRYLPRLYLKHVLGESDYRALGGGKKVSDMGYLKERRDIPEEIRQVILGEITDPGFLAATGVAKPMRDMALLDWLANIAGNTEWVDRGTVVDWQGMTVSVRWLQLEAARLRKQAAYYTPANAATANQIALQMDAVVDSATDGTAPDPALYRQIPDTGRYGRLRGMWVRKEIYDDLMGVHDFLPTNAGWVQNLLGYGGIGTKVTQLWKMSKVALNPPGQVRNFVSNAVMLQLSGVPLYRLPDTMIRAARQIVSDGQYFKIAKKYGVTASTFSVQELGRIRTDLLNLEIRTKGLHPLARIKMLFGVVANAASDMYQFSETMFKTAKIMDAMQRHGMDEAAAAIEAHKWMFDYSLVPQNVRYARNAPIGVPFVTYIYKVLPRLLEVALLHPQRLLPWVGLMYGLGAVAASAFGVDTEDLDKLKKALPEWLQERGNTAFLPFKDELGRVQAVDLGYFFPWSQWQEFAGAVFKGEAGKAAQAAGLFSGPITDLLVAMKTGTDSFTKKPIWNKADPPARQAADIVNYLWDLAMPPFITSRGVLSPMGLVDERYGGKAVQAAIGTTNKFGEPRNTAAQAALALIGVNLYAVDPDHTRAQNIIVKQREMQDVEQRLKQQLTDRGMSDERKQALVRDYVAEIGRRTKELQEYMAASEVHPNLKAGQR